jgi:V/A-type H+-transporting ATPase subunit D
MEHVSPTRTELLTRRAHIQLARQGAELLRGKREALVREFLAALEEFVAGRNQTRQDLSEATGLLIRSLAIDGAEAIASAALACRRAVTVELEEENIWGTKVVDVKSCYTLRSSADRGYSPRAVSARIDETAAQFEKVVLGIIKISPVDRKLQTLADEIRKTSRRVNALEQRLLPTLAEQVRFIQDALDQRERDDIFRLKRLKQKHADRARF